MGPSINETSDKIRQRTQELVAEKKSKPEKELQDRKYALDVKRDKKRSNKLWIIISAMAAVITLLFIVLAHYESLPKSMIEYIPHPHKQQTSTNNITSSQESVPGGGGKERGK